MENTLTPQHNCPECGADPYKLHDYDKMVRDNRRISQLYTEMAAKHAVDKAEAWLRQVKQESSMKWLQNKANKQASALRKLEERIRTLGRRPYETPTSVADLEPGDLLCGGTLVVTQVHHSFDQIQITGQFAPEAK